MKKKKRIKKRLAGLPCCLEERLIAARQMGLLEGPTVELRGRVTKSLLARVKARTGVKSHSKLILLGLVNLALTDDYTEWLLSQRGTVDRSLDLEF